MSYYLTLRQAQGSDSPIAEPVVNAYLVPETSFKGQSLSPRRAYFITRSGPNPATYVGASNKPNENEWYL